MKKIFSLILAIIFVFSFSACKNKSSSSDKNVGAVNSDQSDDNGLINSEDQNTESDNQDTQSDFQIDFSTQDGWNDNMIDFGSDNSIDFEDTEITSKPTNSTSSSSSNSSSQNQSEHTHSWQSATCQAPKTCSICNATEGEKGNHKYTNGQCVYCGASESVAEEEKPENERYSDYINYRGYNEALSDKKYVGALSNTYKKLATKKELNVVYFGGSVTYGYGSEDSDQKGSWRVRVGDWLSTTFPKVKINNFNRAIGDTGTNLGLFRLNRDVISVNPDLLFIEFSINDYYEGLDYISASTNFETIIRTVKEALPECDIVTILVTDRNEAPNARTTKTEKGDLKAGELHLQAKAHEYISKKYNIPSIHVGRALADEIFKVGDGVFSNDIWAEYVKDGVHPLNKGYDIYFNVIKEFLSNSLLNGGLENCEIVKQKLPQKVNLKLNNGAVTLLEDSSSKVTFTTNNGAVYSPDEGGLTDRWANGGYKGIISFPKGSADTVTVKFTGKELVMVVTSALSKNDTFEFSIDGGNSWTKCNYSSKNPVTVLKGTQSEEYTVIIKPAVSSAVSIDCFYSRN